MIYDNIYDAIAASLPTASEMATLKRRIGTQVKTTIKDGSSFGVPLKESTVLAKKYRGSPTPYTKLSEFGELHDSVRELSTVLRVQIGFDDKDHTINKRSGSSIMMAALAKMNNEGHDSPRIPKREFMAIRTILPIVRDWLLEIVSKRNST